MCISSWWFRAGRATTQSSNINTQCFDPIHGADFLHLLLFSLRNEVLLLVLLTIGGRVIDEMDSTLPSSS